MLFGSGCASQQKVIPTETECVPDIRIQEKIIPVPAELTQTHYCPPVPSSGNNETLLNWAEQCGVNARKASDQLNAIRELK